MLRNSLPDGSKLDHKSSLSSAGTAARKTLLLKLVYNVSSSHEIHKPEELLNDLKTQDSTVKPAQSTDWSGFWSKQKLPSAESWKSCAGWQPWRFGGCEWQSKARKPSSSPELCHVPRPCCWLGWQDDTHRFRGSPVLVPPHLSALALRSSGSPAHPLSRVRCIQCTFPLPNRIYLFIYL